MSKVIDDFKNKFQTEELMISETDYWVWSLRPAQATIGAGVLSLKRECPEFAGLLEEEFSDLHNIIPVIENTLKSTFDYDVINYLMLMMLDKQVHYHIIPRYERTIDFAGEKWNDEGWPGVPNLSVGVSDKTILKSIHKRLQENLVK